MSPIAILGFSGISFCFMFSRGRRVDVLFYTAHHYAAKRFILFDKLQCPYYIIDKLYFVTEELI